MFIALALLVLPSAVVAQGGGGGRGMGGFAPQNVAKLMLEDANRTSLQLTEEQVVKITALATKVDSLTAPVAAEMQKLRESMGGGGPPSEEVRGKMMEQRQKQQKVTADATAELRTILDEAQFTRAEAIIQAAQPRGRRGGGGGRL